MIQHKISSLFFKFSASLLAFALCDLAAQAQTPMVQVPFVTSVLGIPTSTYNSTTATAPCTTGLNATTGDGCPGTQAPLTYPYSVAVDSFGNLVTASASGTVGITVLYEGGSTMSSLLVAAKTNIAAFTPVVGNAYFLNTGTATLAASGTNASGAPLYYCNGSSGTVALDKYENGCPAAYAYLQARSVTVDAEGSIFIGEYEPVQTVRVIYAGGVRAANLIKAYNPTVTAPQVGYIYAISSSTGLDFISMRGIAVQPVNATTENIFVADNGTSANETGVDAATSGNQIKEFVCPSGTTGCNTTAATINSNKTTAAGWVTYIPGTTTAGVTSAYGDGGSPSLALVDDPTCLQVDKYGNLFIGDVGDLRIRVVYNAGTTPPLYVEGVNSNASVTPVAGDIYTVVGGASSSSTVASPAQANLVPTGATNFGLDAAGNLYFTKSGTTLWVENASTGIAINSMWAGAHSTTYSANTSPAQGAGCNGTAVGSVTGPAMTDAYADGCPASEVNDAVPDFTPFVFDSAGNFYMVDARQPSAATAVVRKYSYANQFGSVPVGSSVTAAFAFTPSINQGTKTYTPVLSFTSPEYSDAGGGNCTTETGTYSTQTCVYNVTFKPTRAGARPGSLTLSQSGTGTLDSIVLGGTGTGAQISLDPSTQSTIGAGLVPAGVAVDASGNAYIADTTSGNIYKSTSGGTPASFATGLKTPAQAAVNGGGTVFVADKGNNRIASVTSAGGPVSVFLPTTFALTTGSLPSSSTSTTLISPAGVAVDLSGNVYLSDTGNNRVIEVITPLGGAASTNVLLGFSGLSSPQGLAVDASGNVFVADSGNARVVELSAAGVQSTVSISSTLTTPVGVALDAAGDLYIADSGNQSVLLVPSGSSTANTLLGSTTGLAGLAVDNTGNVFVASATAGGLLELNRTGIAVAYPLTNVGSPSVQTLTLSNTGNATLTIGSSLGVGTDTTNFSLAPATTNGCSVNGSLAPGANCVLATTFQPQAIGKFTDTVTFSSSSAANLATALLSGSGVKETSTTTAVSYATTSPVTPTGGLPIAGLPYTFTATINLSANVGVPTGTVIFTVDGTAQKPVNVASATSTTATATISLTLLAGSHTITALYGGDSNYGGSTQSLTVTAVTQQTSKLALTYSLGTPTGSTISTVLTATLTAPSTTAAFTGTITFTVDSIVQTPAATVTSAGVASITVPLTAGSHTITATYMGTSYYTSSTGSATFVVVTGTSSLSLSAAPTGSVTFGTPVTVTAKTVTGNSTATPTGSIVFTLNGQAQTAIAYGSSVPDTFSTLAPGNYTVTASYTGDTNYAPAQSQQTIAFTVVQYPSTTSLQVTPVVTTKTTNNVTTATTTITLSATMNQAFPPAYPTGTVIFSNGTTALGTVKLPLTAAGVATLPGISSAITNLSFTAAYSGDSNYLPSTVSVSLPAFALSPVITSLAVPQNAVVADPLYLTAFNGYTGSIKLSCAGLPANSTCAFSPILTTFTSANNSVPQLVTLQVITNTQPVVAAGFVQKGSLPISLTSYLGLCLCFFGLSWRRHRRLGRLLLSMVFLTMVIGLSSCASDTASNSVYPTPTGTYTIAVTATDGAVTTTTNIPVTVIAGTTNARP